MDLSIIISTLSTTAKGLLLKMSNLPGPHRPPLTGKAQVLAEAELQQRGLLVFRKVRSSSSIFPVLTNSGTMAANTISAAK